MSRENKIPEESEATQVHLPVLGDSSKESGERESNLSEEFLRIPTLGSFHGSDEVGLSSRSGSGEWEELLSGISSFDESLKDSSLRDDGSRKTYSIVLEDKEEKEIARRVNKEFKQEFRSIKQQALEKQKYLRKKFQSEINSARASLLLARVNAERKAIDKLEEKAEEKEAEIIEKRKKRRQSIVTKKTGKSLLGDVVFEFAALRKVRAELDRARARRRSTIATTILATRRFNLGTAVPDYDTKNLEKAEEVQKLVYELQKLGLDEAANDLVLSLHNKKKSEEQMRETLREEWRYARTKAINKREKEIQKLRLQKLEEKEILEMERMEREMEERKRKERERLRRQMEALRRKAFNISLRKIMDESKLVTSISRPYTYSYFKPL